jgi:hypothetical protein
MRRDKITTPTLIPSLEEVRNRFEAWRKNRKHREPIPDVLWEAAARLCKEHSIQRTAKALHLNYSDLKRRVHNLDIVYPPGADSRSAFVELDISKSILPTECIVEMEGAGGAKMKVHFKGEVDFDLLGLTKAFLDKRR